MGISDVPRAPRHGRQQPGRYSGSHTACGCKVSGGGIDECLAGERLLQQQLQRSRFSVPRARRFRERAWLEIVAHGDRKVRLSCRQRTPNASERDFSQ